MSTVQQRHQVAVTSDELVCVRPRQPSEYLRGNERICVSAAMLFAQLSQHLLMKHKAWSADSRREKLEKLFNIEEGKIFQ